MRFSLLFSLVIWSASLVTNGCTSIMAHAGPYQGYYPGVKNDAEMLKKGDMGWAMMPFIALDIPFSAVADTLFLPYDAYRAGKDQTIVSPRERIKAVEAKKPQKQQSQTQPQPQPQMQTKLPPSK